MPRGRRANSAAHIAHELEGVEKLPGTYPFTLERSVKGYRLNAFLHDLVDPEKRRAFLADPEEAFEACGSPRRSAISSAAATGRA